MAAVAAGAGAAGGVAPSESSAKSGEGTGPEMAGWKLVFDDEFEKEGRVDEAKWAFEIGHIRNHELQYYTDRAENCRVANGVLVLEARREDYAPASANTGAASRPVERITSASIETRGKAEWTYGRAEVRARMTTALGTWPAIWMLGSNIDKVGWPRCGEIDIMENVGYMPGVIHGTVHTAAYNHVKKTQRGATTRLSAPASENDWHVYAMEWGPERVELFLDGVKYFSFENEHKTEKGGDAEWPFAQPFYLKLNLAFGGAWGGVKGVDEKALPQRMEVDYVRYYQREGK